MAEVKGSNRQAIHQFPTHLLLLGFCAGIMAHRGLGCYSYSALKGQEVYICLHSPWYRLATPIQIFPSALLPQALVIDPLVCALTCIVTAFARSDHGIRSCAQLLSIRTVPGSCCYLRCSLRTSFHSYSGPMGKVSRLGLAGHGRGIRKYVDVVFLCRRGSVLYLTSS